jgi:tRNA-dihydrouridine synthase B
MYGGSADWKAISKLKEFITVPVFANGDVTNIDSAIQCLKESNADGIAVARGVLGNPDLLHRIEHYFKTGEILPEICRKTKIALLKEHLDEEIALRGEKNGIEFTRKFYPYYIKGIRDAAQYRYALVTENVYDKIIKILEEIV